LCGLLFGLWQASNLKSVRKSVLTVQAWLSELALYSCLLLSSWLLAPLACPKVIKTLKQTKNYFKLTVTKLRKCYAFLETKVKANFANDDFNRESKDKEFKFE